MHFKEASKKPADYFPSPLGIPASLSLGQHLSAQLNTGQTAAEAGRTGQVLGNYLGASQVRRFILTPGGENDEKSFPDI